MFDSGVGGLTVLKECLKLMPHESYFYLGDTARFPYGGKSRKTILKYSVENALYLMQQEIDLLVIACATATSQAHAFLQSTFSIPVIGVIEPTVEKVARTTQNKRIGVMATRGTIRSKVYQNGLREHIEGAKIVAEPCPLLVSLVEEQVKHPHIIRMVIKESLKPIKKQGVDTLVLGSTHYPLLESYIQEEMGPDTILINQGKACAEKIASCQNLSKKKKNPELHFFVSDDPQRFKSIGEYFLGFPMKQIKNVII